MYVFVCVYIYIYELSVQMFLYTVNDEIICTPMNIEYFDLFLRIEYLYDAKLFICY